MAHRSALVATATRLLSYHGPFLASQRCKAKVRKGERNTERWVIWGEDRKSAGIHGTGKGS